LQEFEARTGQEFPLAGELTLKRDQFASIEAKGGRSNRRSNLTKMHDLCRIQHAAGSRDFSVSAIGRLAEGEGIMKGRALHNAQSADYRGLIGAWAAYAGPPVAGMTDYVTATRHRPKRG
jgi:hypothetical protein